MPHITLEYSGNLRNLDESWVLLQVNKALLGLGIFMDADIKTRIHRLNSFRIGVAAEETGDHAFVAATVELLSGREFSVKEHLGQVVLKALERCCREEDGPLTQISVHVRELQSELYFKSVSKRR
ncbi:5-carboxymethyl-2-hydroxymuconate Delta-isomerase [Limnobacter parvus]|uniref:5-carboxymethyl-2-hydroxymuconate isomerase n=1 Tax=Limnobacter parvus TaxID=2939690 RepID=A0ABT1XDR2_9BURK|nr:5-carboxymethyl-2-hydroxymuconate isomerase [Limnobacter parvus]MCR2745420.1 5-carboxymethyl-2-hydroxymuconate isomerase [Limnobacter parvus]